MASVYHVVMMKNQYCIQTKNINFPSEKIVQKKQLKNSHCTKKNASWMHTQE